ncbi:fucolectin-5-like [Lissotriton helveticus]
MKLLTVLLFGFSIFGGVWTDPACDPTPTTEDLALKGTASQSSQYAYLGLPSYAINTKRNGKYADKTCSHTDEEPNPWWRLDLGQSQAIGSIVVVNRADCCPERLNGAEVRVGDNENNNNPVCGTITDLSAGSVTTLCCKGMAGRYVTVVIPGRSEFLTLCGVEVYGVVPQKQQPNVCW